MAGTNPNLTRAVEVFLADLARVRSSGRATGELSAYGPLENLLNAVGATLKPKVFCVGGLANQGAGHPDFGLYAARQRQRGRVLEGQVPVGLWMNYERLGTVIGIVGAAVVGAVIGGGITCKEARRHGIAPVHQSMVSSAKASPALGCRSRPPCC